MRQVFSLIRKDFLLESRQQYSFYGILIYLVSTIFVVYLTMGQPQADVWNSMFWIIQLFVCVNAVAKSFLQQSRGIMLYYYSVAGAKDFILAKLFFNVLLMLLMSGLSLLVFVLFLGNPLQSAIQFTSIAFLGGTGLSLTFTFLSAIAAKAQQSALVAIMGFPIVLPQLILLSKISSISFSSVVQTGLWQMILLLICLDALVVLLAVILFPFLWKD